MTKEELEKEAEEFTDSKKSFWRQGRTCIESVKQAYIAGVEPREKRIAELEKENAELKEQNRNYEQLIDKGSVTLVKEKLKNYRQLTKANLLLEDIYKIAMGDWNDPKWHDQVLRKAREYIKEIKGKMTERDLYLHNLYEDICARFRYIGRNYPDVNLKDCVVIGNEQDLTPTNYISDVPYIYCATIEGFRLGKCENYKACRDFEDGFK